MIRLRKVWPLAENGRQRVNLEIGNPHKVSISGLKLHLVFMSGEALFEHKILYAIQAGSWKCISVFVPRYSYYDLREVLS